MGLEVGKVSDVGVREVICSMEYHLRNVHLCMVPVESQA